MPAALSIFRLCESDPLRFERTISSQDQLTLIDVGVTQGLPPATSVLQFRGRRGNQLHYRAVHLTETIDRPVRVFLNELNTVYEDVVRPTIVPKPGTTASRSVARDLRFGYQEIHRFDVTLDFDEKEIYAYYTKEVVDQLMRRLKGRIQYEAIRFELSKITELPEIQNVFGAWASGRGRVKKHAYFGTELDKEPNIDHASITSYHVEYEDENGSAIDLFISRDCKLSSRHPLVTSEHLHRIYGSMKQALQPLAVSASADSRE